MFFKRIASIIVGVAIALAPMNVSARPLHGGVAASGGGGGSTLLTTLTIQNTSGSTQAANFVTQVFGHPFKKGDIANGCAGGAPIFKRHANNAVVPFSEGLAPVCWSDGSLKWAPFMLLDPASIAGSGTDVIDIYSGGTTPAASSRALSDASSASTDLNVTVTGKDNLSGVWVSNLNQGISAALADNYTYMDGDAGKVVRVRAPYRQSGADHGQLEGYWYLQLLNTNTGTFAGMRYMHRMTQPWYNITSPSKNWRSFSAFAMNNGASLIRDMFSGHFGIGRNFTWSAGVDLTSTAHSLDTGFLVNLTTTGSLPTGLATLTTYFVGASSANTFYLSTISSGGMTFDFVQTPSSACTGTCTATAYPFISQHSSIYTAGTTAKYDYVQAGGAAASDTTTRITMNNTYWRSTRLIGPYAFGTVSPSAFSSTTYYPGSAGPLVRNIGTTGERPDIGPFTSYAVAHMYLQDAADEQNVRVIGLVGGFLQSNFKNKTTFTIPVANNGHASNGTTYSGMPAVKTDFTPSNTGFGVQVDTAVGSIGFTGADYSHLPEFNYYALEFTGEPQFNDQETEMGSLSMINHYGLVEPNTAVVNGVTNSMCGISNNGGGQRNCSINGTTYYGASTGSPNGLRLTAWINRDAGYAAAIAGGYEPAGVSTRQYLNDINNTIYASYNAYTAMLPAYAQAAGIYGEGDLDSRNGSWHTGYLHGTTAIVSQMTENTDALSFATYIARWDKWVHDNFGTWMVPFYYGIVRTGNTNTPAGNSSYNPYLTSTDGFCGLNDRLQASWTNGSNTFTFVNLDAATGAGGYVPSNNDQIVWATISFGLQDLPPTNFSQYVTYFMKSVSGMNFELSATRGGTSITPGNTLSNQKICLGAVGGPATGTIYPGNGAGSGALQENVAAMNVAKAAGATVDATTMTDINARLLALDPTLSGAANDGLKWSFQQSY